MEIIKQELRFFLFSLLMGILILFCYDFLRILRVIFPHKKWLVFIGDYLFWLCAGIAVFVMAYQVNDGVIRGFSVIAIGIGMALYHFGPSIYFVRGVSYFPRKITRMFAKRKRK